MQIRINPHLAPSKPQESMVRDWQPKLFPVLNDRRRQVQVVFQKLLITNSFFIIDYWPLERLCLTCWSQQPMSSICPCIYTESHKVFHNGSYTLCNKLQSIPDGDEKYQLEGLHLLKHQWIFTILEPSTHASRLISTYDMIYYAIFMETLRI